MANKEEKKEIEDGKLSIRINIVREMALDKRGKPVKTPQGEVSYVREDCNGLMSLLNRFDSRLHDMKDLKMFLKLKDKIYNAWAKDENVLELSLDEAGFLSRYLSEFKEKEGKDNPLREFEIRTLVGVLEELG